MEIRTININMDTACSVCGEMGACDGDRCLKCVTDAVIAAKQPGTVREFKKIKVDLATKFLELTYTERRAVGEEMVETEYDGVRRKVEVHQDLRDAMANFIPHMVILCELHDEAEFRGRNLVPFSREEMAAILKYDVQSISTGGQDEHFGITISGRKTLRGGKVFNINAPFTKFEGGEHETPYAYAGDMHEAFMLLEKEVNLFLDEGKVAPSTQTKMDFEQAA